MEINLIRESTDFVKKNLKETPEIGVILGSGLGDLAEKIQDRIITRYSDIPNMPSSTVQGHAGQFVFGKLGGKSVVMMQGRIHYYEGHDLNSVVLPVYIMKSLGVKKLLVTNAAGGVNKKFKPGDLMIIKDHINFAFNNPLIGINFEEIGPRFPDMSMAYDKHLISVARECALKNGIEIKEGTYLMMTGPSYETPAEIRMVRTLGGDAVGMSTVPEVIAANHCGIRTLGISCITNMASGILNQPLSHKEVIETSNKIKNKFILLLMEIIKKI